AGPGRTAVGPLRGRRAGASVGADRYGPVPSPLPYALAAGPAGPSAPSHHLRAAQRRRWGGAVAGTELCGRSALGQPPGPRGVRPRRGQDPFLRSASQGVDGTAPAAGDRSSVAET